MNQNTETKESGGTQKKWLPSLKWEMTVIMLACWVVPVIIILLVVSHYFTGSITRQVEDTVSTAVENAAIVSQSRLDSAVDASREASYNPIVKNAWRAYRRDRDETALYTTVTDFLHQQYRYRGQYLAAVLFFTEEPEKVYYMFDDSQSRRYDRILRYNSDAHSGVLQLAEGLGTGIGFLENGGSLYLVRNIVDEDFQTYAILVLELDAASVFGSFLNVPWVTGAAVRVNGVDVPLMGERPDAAALGLPVLEAEGSGMADLEHSFAAYGLHDTHDYKLSYTVCVDKINLFNELSGFQGVLVLLALLVAPLLGLALWFFYVNISRPIGGLVAASKHIESGELGFATDVSDCNREFRHLTESFNSMSGRLREQFERIYTEELALRDARILALQSQINPHFLNNTLEIINWEARLSGSLKVSHMIEALSTMLDAVLDRRGSPVVRLSEELMHVSAYLYIISVRLGTRLTVEKQIDEALLERFVPRLVLQPILENAVEHGISARQRGTLLIHVYEEDSCLILETINDGTLDEESRVLIARLLSDDIDTRTERSSNLGIFNVNQRLHMLCPPGSGLSIYEENEQVHAKIVITGEAGQSESTNGK